MFKYLNKSGNSYKIDTPKEFSSDKAVTIKPGGLKKVFKFAYDMTFGGKGEHRNHRSGGKEERTNGQKFINVFQGKLAECGVCKFFHQNRIELPLPDFGMYSLGIWDRYDFKYKNMEVSVKSTTFFGNLLLLETKDWDKDGNYIPNLKDSDDTKYDSHILVRIKPDGKKIMKENKLYFLDFCDEDILEKIILNEEWKIEITGYITNEDLKYVINNNYILPQNSLLGKYTKMDAENYYVQAGNLRDIRFLIDELKNK